MIYFDYTATTPINKEVLDTFINSCQYYANPNSDHKIGKIAKKVIDESISSIAELTKVKPNEIIFTSGSSESNNLAIIGLAEKYPEKNHIITTKFEHSSVLAPIAFLQKKGYNIDFIETDENGIISIDKLLNLITDKTLLVSIIAVNSEIGIIQPINKIALALKNKDIFFHVDATQAIGKIPFSFDNIDLISFTAHKIYGIKGIGCLIKKENVNLLPIIYGGSSTTKYRSGTPTTQLIASLAKALQLAYQNLETNFEYVSKLNKVLYDSLVSEKNIMINSNKYCSPYIFNLSILNIDANKAQEILSNQDIFVSTKSACSSKSSKSIQILNLFHDELRAKTSIRISLSYLTTKDDLNILISAIKKISKGEINESY